MKGNVEPEAVFQTVSKTGKKTAYWPVEAAPEPKAETEPKTETEAKPEAETKTEVAKVDVEPKLAEAETKPTNA